MKKESICALFLACAALLFTACGGGGGGGGGAVPSVNKDAADVGATTPTPPAVDPALAALEKAGMKKVVGSTVVGSDDYNYKEDGKVVFTGAFPKGRTVTVKDFYICDHEVTQGEYELYCGYKEKEPTERGPDYPACFVSLYDAAEYCNIRSKNEGFTPCYSLNGFTDPADWKGLKLNNMVCDWDANGYRLPTEVEWEYAARGGKEMLTFQYPGSDDLFEVAWVVGTPLNEGNKIHRVKTKKENTLGLYDMVGNVDEWCWDWYGDIKPDTPVTGVEKGNSRVYRGHSSATASSCHIASGRCRSSAGTRDHLRGFRVVRTEP